MKSDTRSSRSFSPISAKRTFSTAIARNARSTAGRERQEIDPRASHWLRHFQQAQSGSNAQHGERNRRADFLRGDGRRYRFVQRGRSGRWLSAGQEPADHFRQYDGRLRVVPAISRARCPIFSTPLRAFLRSQYTLGFTPSTPQDGKYHKLKVEAVDEQGNPLTFADKKGKKKKTIVHASARATWRMHRRPRTEEQLSDVTLPRRAGRLQRPRMSSIAARQID